MKPMRRKQPLTRRRQCVDPRGMTMESYATREELLKEIATRDRDYSELLRRVRMYQATTHSLAERFDAMLAAFGRLETRIQDLETPPRAPLPQEPIRAEIVKVYLEAVEELAEAGASATQVRSILGADGCDTPECSVDGETFTAGLPLRGRFLAARREFGVEAMERARDIVTSPAVFSILYTAATSVLSRGGLAPDHRQTEGMTAT